MISFVYVNGNVFILSNFRLSLDINSLFLRIKVKCLHAKKFPGVTYAVLFENSLLLSHAKSFGPLSRCFCDLPSASPPPCSLITSWLFLLCSKNTDVFIGSLLFSTVYFCSHDPLCLKCLSTFMPSSPSTTSGPIQP